VHAYQPEKTPGIFRKEGKRKRGRKEGKGREIERVERDREIGLRETEGQG